MHNFGNGIQQPQQYQPQPQQYQQQYQQPQQYQQNQQQSQNQTTYSDKLDIIYNMGFPYNHLITIALMKRTPIQNLNVKDYKERFFYFLTLAPGVGTADNRTYDFQQKISLKYSLRELCSLSFALKQCSTGNENNVLPYTKFAKNDNQTKNISIWVSSKTSQSNNQTHNSKIINFSFNSNTKYAVALAPSDAFSIGEIFKNLFDYGLKLEIDFRQNNPLVNNNNSGDKLTIHGGYSQDGNP